MHAGRSWAANRADALRGLVIDTTIPPIVRATAVGLLARQIDDAALDVIDQVLQGDETLIQLSALDVLESTPPELRIQAAQQFLTHPLRSLRMAAARVLLPARDELSDRRADDLDTALAEYRDAQLFNADRAEGLLNWGSTLAQLGRPDEAVEFLENAIERAPAFSPAYINLADIYRLSGTEERAQALLIEAIEYNPQGAGAHFALGLSLVRSGDPQGAFAELERAAELAPDAPHYQYVIGIALNSNGERGRAIESLAQAHERFPGHRDTLLALATIHRDGGEIGLATEYARRLLALSPSDNVARGLLNELESLTH